MQNADDLREHIYITHVPYDSDGRYSCHWDGCSEDDTFSDKNEYKNHVERAHINKIVWHQGDGPHGTNLGEYMSDDLSYLNDADGRPVTPSVDGQAVGGGSSTRGRKRKFGGDLLDAPVDESASDNASVDIDTFRKVLEDNVVDDESVEEEEEGDEGVEEEEDEDED